MREKLIELAHDARMNAHWHSAKNPIEYEVDYLIANGVTIPVRCKDCVWCEQGKSYVPYCNHPTDGMHDVQQDDFCSYGERRKDES